MRKKFICFLLFVIMLFQNTFAYDFGDADANGQITENDSSEILKKVLDNSYVTPLEKLLSPEEALKLLDVTGSGKLTATDCAAVWRKVKKTGFLMPVEAASSENTSLTESSSETTTETVSETSAESTTEAVTETASETSAESTTEAATETTSETASESTTETTEITSETASESTTETTETTSETASESTTETTETTSETATESTTETTETTSETATESTTDALSDIEKSLPSIPTSFANTESVSTFSALKTAISGFENSTGDYAVYITDDISCNASLKLAKNKYGSRTITLIGVQKPDGTYPILDFAEFRDSAASSGDSMTGIYVSGSGYNFKDLIVENAPDCGVRIKGSSAGHCIFEGFVTRYNCNSGISVTSGGSYNTFKYVDAYRNCDLVQKLASDADGFSVKLNFGEGNVFYNCRAWDNGDDGWDSFEKKDDVGNNSIYYYECLTRHNGSANTFNGIYDYQMGYPLDKKLPYIQALMAADPDFENKYNNKELSTDNWPVATVTMLGGKTATYSNGKWSGNQSGYAEWGGNPNGFKFGSAYVTSDAYRYVRNCISFDHESKGFDQNNCAALVNLENTISFDNTRNYHMENMTAENFENAVNFGNGVSASTRPKAASGVSVGFASISSSAGDALKAEIISQFENDILEKVRSNTVPGRVIFDYFN